MPRGRYQPVFAGLLLFSTILTAWVRLCPWPKALRNMTWLRKSLTNHQQTGTHHLKFTFVSWFWKICARKDRTGYSVGQAGLAAVRLSLTELCVIQADGRTQKPRTLTSHHVTLYTSFSYILGAATDGTFYTLSRLGKKWFFQTCDKSNHNWKKIQHIWHHKHDLRNYLYINMIQLLYLFFKFPEI
jgi:hypothetical protein